MNPVVAGLVKRASDWRWSSARAHLAGRDDGLVTVAAALQGVSDFGDFLDQPADTASTQRLLAGRSIGRPLMPDERLKELEQTLGQRLRPLPRGPRPRQRGEASQGDSGI